MNKLITINRQFGSGGREVGRRLADKLGIAYYDKELINAIAEKTGFDEKYIEQCDEQAISGYTFTFARAFSTYQQSPSEQIQIATCKIIKEITHREDAIIIGRCANYILEEQKPLSVFIYSSDNDFRVKRCFDKVPSDRESKTEKEMLKDILAIDKKRSKYYEFYTANEWMKMSQYSLCIDTSKVGINNAVDIICTALNFND